MKYVCLGFHEERFFSGMSESERADFIGACFAYDDELRRNGHFIGGTALEGPQTAATLRFDNGKIAVTDGPFAETKEQLGGFLVLEASDLNEAIRLMSQHPCLRMGSTFELRPINEELSRELAERCGVAAQC
jgi:hypothetical protein